MKTNSSLNRLLTITLMISLFAASIFTGRVPKTVETVDVRQGDTMDIQVQNGATWYKGLIPAFVLGTTRENTPQFIEEMKAGAFFCFFVIG